ncbi:hypothetical protein AB0F81_05090 [Actinoplanes sp. NPDC024001]|uniref:hypothetical protein n=1 Tax=Actinoplanes sp. NPDC024001 TaxID=3154598 RepID=UPI0033E4C19A
MGGIARTGGASIGGGLGRLAQLAPDPPVAAGRAAELRDERVGPVQESVSDRRGGRREHDGVAVEPADPDAELLHRVNPLVLPAEGLPGGADLLQPSVGARSGPFLGRTAGRGVVLGLRRILVPGRRLVVVVAIGLSRSWLPSAFGDPVPVRLTVHLGGGLRTIPARSG